MSPLTLELPHAPDAPASRVMPSANHPSVTVIVPCRNEEKHICRCLESILANDYPRDRMEILIVDGISEDRTPEIVKAYADRYPFIRLVNNPEKHIPGALNRGIRAACGDTIIKMDAHSTYQPDHISLCIGFQEKYGAENVGGVCRMSPGADTAVAQAIALGLGHRFGSGNAGVKVGVKQPTWSDAAAFGCFKKELFTRIGFFDERLLGSSDMDMNVRIRASGGRILLVPQVVIGYCTDSSLRSFWKHNFADGVWATYVLKFGSRGWSWRHWVPLLFLLSLVGPLAVSRFYPGLLWLTLSIAGLYLTTSLAVSVRIALREHSWKAASMLPLVFGVRHLAHGLGSLLGLFLAVVPGMRWKGRRSMRG
jgi:glycosyltransferase involved in cell wall biosynthesis